MTRTTARFFRLLLVAAGCQLAAACGLKGALYIPVEEPGAAPETEIETEINTGIGAGTQTVIEMEPAETQPGPTESGPSDPENESEMDAD